MTVRLFVVGFAMFLVCHATAGFENGADESSQRWLRYAPGTRIVARTLADEVVGTIVNEAGEPLEHVDVSFPGSAIEYTDKEGEFRYSRKLNQQRVLRACHPDYQMWHGAPHGGDVLRIEMKKKHDSAKNDRTRRLLTVRLIDSRNAEPIPGVIVEAENWEGPKQYTVTAEAVTNKEGIAEFRELEYIGYRLRQRADHPVPYVQDWRHPSADEAEVVILLDRACELTLRAVDSESGVGLAGVEFHRENAAGEMWAAPVTSDILGIDAKERQGAVTDAEGNSRFLVGPQTWSYMIGRFPNGYRRIAPMDGRQEVTVETPPGEKVQFTFRLIRESRG